MSRHTIATNLPVSPGKFCIRKMTPLSPDARIPVFASCYGPTRPSPPQKPFGQSSTQLKPNPPLRPFLLARVLSLRLPRLPNLPLQHPLCRLPLRRIRIQSSRMNHIDAHIENVPTAEPTRSLRENRVIAITRSGLGRWYDGRTAPGAGRRSPGL